MDTQPQDRRAARKFLLTGMACIGVAIIAVAIVNLGAFAVMIQPQTQTFAEMLSGWSRIYRPILYDILQPEIAFFGPSWARDAFDPAMLDDDLHAHSFNYGISGATAYEVRRFVQSSMANPNLKTAVLDIDTFDGAGAALPTEYGFDESLLDKDADGNPNEWVKLERAFALTLSGAAIGQNAELLSKLALLKIGHSRESLLESYDQLDFSEREAKVEAARRRVLPPGDDEPGDGLVAPSPPIDQNVALEFERTMDALCTRSINVYAYFTPHDLAVRDCDPKAMRERYFLGRLKARAGSCSAHLSYWAFFYPNAATLDGVARSEGLSDLYRIDGHPRPTLGRLMAAKMFGKPLPAGAPAGLAADFGEDLLSLPDADDWLAKRADRCTGEWDDKGRTLLDVIKTGSRD